MLRYESFLTSAKLFKMERDRIVRNLSVVSGSEDIINIIKDVMGEGASFENKIAIVEYLNAIISGKRRICNLIEKNCGKDLFLKLLNTGLTKI